MATDSGRPSGNQIGGVISLIFLIFIMGTFISMMSSSPMPGEFRAFSIIFVIVFIFIFISIIKQIAGVGEEGGDGGLDGMRNVHVIVKREPGQPAGQPYVHDTDEPPPPPPPLHLQKEPYDFAEALRDLDSLKKEGLISESEYEKKRKEIMDRKW